MKIKRLISLFEIVTKNNPEAELWFGSNEVFVDAVLLAPDEVDNLSQLGFDVHSLSYDLYDVYL